MSITSLTASAGMELRWWLLAVARVVRRFPGPLAVVVAVLWLGWVSLPTGWIAAGAVLGGLLRCWALGSPRTFQRWLSGPLRRTRWRLWLRRHWPEVAEACGLGRQAKSRTRETVDAHLPVPRLHRVSTDGCRISLHVRPLVGQTVGTFSDAAEQLRMAVGATRVRVDPEAANRVCVTFTVGDGLGEAFPAQCPRPGVEMDLDAVSMGRCEDGSTWRLPVGPHTLVAGTSGAGKGSVFWSFVFGLAPAVREGRVQLHGVDLKGGMEVLMGADLFTTRATDAAEAVALLERLVGLLRERTRAYAGRVRSHVATVNEPLHVVMIDELAALTAYCPERDLQRRAEMAVNLLCSQGRAPGFVVFACLQDPRKEVIPSRGLFTQMVGLRLKDATETSMVLGEGAVAAGAHCHRIIRGTPGMGYVVPEDGGFPVRVRAGFVTDAQIRAVAAQFASPTQYPLDVPPRLPLEQARGERRPRPQGTEVA